MHCFYLKDFYFWPFLIVDRRFQNLGAMRSSHNAHLQEPLSEFIVLLSVVFWSLFTPRLAILCMYLEHASFGVPLNNWPRSFLLKGLQNQISTK